jgi:hypothetical protein
MTTDRRLATLPAALGFLQLPPRAPELRLLHCWLDTWTGVGLIAVGVERQGLLLSLSHIAEGEWRAQFMGNALVAPKGFGVAATPWKAVQIAAWAAVKARPGCSTAWRDGAVPGQGGRDGGHRT